MENRDRLNHPLIKNIGTRDLKCHECLRIIPIEETYWNFCGSCRICLACLEKIYKSIDKEDLELTNLNLTNSKI